MNTDSTYFDVSKDVARLEDDSHEFMVELFSHDVRAQRVVHSDPKQDDEHDPNFISIRAEFQTRLPVPLKLRGSEWDVTLFQACFRNQRCGVYQVQFENLNGDVGFEENLPRRPYENAFELYEQVAQLSLQSEFQRPVLMLTDGTFRVTGGLLVHRGAYWFQRCFDGPLLTHVPSEWYGKGIVNPSVLWYHVLELWRTTSTIRSTRQCTLLYGTILPFWQGHQPFSYLFFWDYTDEAFAHYYLKAGESLSGGLPRRHEVSFWWSLFSVHMQVSPNADGIGYASFRFPNDQSAFTSYFYMVLPKSLAEEVMNLDEMIRLNVARGDSLSVQKFNVAYDDTMVMIVLKMGMELMLPQSWTVELQNLDSHSFLLFQEKGLVQYYVRLPPLYLPPRNLSGRSVMVQAGCFTDQYSSEDDYYFSLRSFPKMECFLWDEDEFGQMWNPAESLFRLFNNYNQNLITSKECKIFQPGLTYLLLGIGYSPKRLDPYYQFPKFLVYEYTAEELAQGHYVLTPGESFPSGDDSSFWQLRDPPFFQKETNSDGQTIIRMTIFPKSGSYWQVFWTILPKEVVLILNLQQFAIAKRDRHGFYTRDGLRGKVAQFAEVPWDSSKMVILWLANRNEYHGKPFDDGSLNLYTFKEYPPFQCLQIRYHGVSKVYPSMNPFRLTQDHELEISMAVDDFFKKFSVVDFHTKLPITDMQSEIILKKEELTSHYFQPWFPPGYVQTIVLSISELEVRDVLLSYDPKTQQWVSQKGYRCSQPFMLPQKYPLVVFQGGSPEHTIKLRERQDGGLHTLTVQLKSLDGIRSPAFYNGLTYIALYFRDRRYLKESF